MLNPRYGIYHAYLVVGTLENQANPRFSEVELRESGETG